MQAIINAMIFDFDNFIANGYLVFDETVEAVGPMSEFDETAGFEKIIDAKGKLVMPSLVAGHTHIYSAFARGLRMPFAARNFQDILDQLWWRLDSKIDNDVTYHSAIVSGIDHLKNGVTTLIDHHASGKEILGSLTSLRQAIADTIGMRGVFAFETSDRFATDECIRENREFARENKTPFAAGMFGLHASMSLSDQTLAKVRTGGDKLPIHIHVAESQMDEDLSVERHGYRIMERLEHSGIITEDSLFVHCIHINDLELGIIKRSGATVCLNVSSNMNNGVGLPDYRKFRDQGIPVILGNDGLHPSMANEYLNLYYATHLYNESVSAFSLQDLQAVIDETYRYASRRLGIRLGRFQKGYAADFLIIPYVPPTPINRLNASGHLFFGLFPSFRPQDVFVAGKRLIRNYQPTGRLKKAYRDSLEAARTLWQRLAIKEENL